MAGTALVLAAIADTVTFLLLPAGAEVNPFAIHSPILAIGAKVALVAFILAAPLKGYARRVRLFGAVAWTAGCLSNVLVLWR